MSLVGQAISELHLGRLPEAEVAIQQALEKDSTDVPALANKVVLTALNGGDTTEDLKYAIKDPVACNIYVYKLTESCTGPLKSRTARILY